jgi:hypothetical protein
MPRGTGPLGDPIQKSRPIYVFSRGSGSETCARFVAFTYNLCGQLLTSPDTHHSANMLSRTNFHITEKRSSNCLNTVLH